MAGRLGYFRHKFSTLIAKLAPRRETGCGIRLFHGTSRLRFVLWGICLAQLCGAGALSATPLAATADLLDASLGWPLSRPIGRARSLGWRTARLRVCGRDLFPQCPTGVDQHPGKISARPWAPSSGKC